MVQELVVTLREGGETSLMLAILFSALKSAGHSAYRAAAWCGFLLALALSVAAGLVLRDLGSLGPLFEATLAWIGAGFVASLAIQLHHGGAYRGQLPAVRESAASSRVSLPAVFTVASFAFVAVIREGLETAVFLSNGASFRAEGAWLGAAAGLSLAAGLGVAIYLGFRRLNLKAFMRTTEILLAALVVSLFFTGAAEFAEAGLLAIPGPLALLEASWIRTGAFLEILLCAAPFLYVWLARAPARDFIRAAGIAAILAVTPQALGAAARQVEHARMPSAERASAVRVESSVRARAAAMRHELAVMHEAVRRSRADEARSAWIAARSRFVQVEPYVAQADPEAAETLNGEAGEAAGFHAVEEALFAAGAPWTSDASARQPLLRAIADLRSRAGAAEGALRIAVLSPERVRAAWAGHRWTLLGRLDGQESAASQTSLLEIVATLDAMDADGGAPGLTAGVRRTLGPALAQATGGPRYGEWTPESTVSLAAMHRPIAIVGADRGFDGVDRLELRRAAGEAFDRIERAPAPSERATAPTERATARL
jgi:high-affinity iron transporter